MDTNYGPRPGLTVQACESPETCHGLTAREWASLPYEQQAGSLPILTCCETCGGWYFGVEQACAQVRS